MKDVIVVGAGIMGATIGEAFRQIQQRDVLILDDRRPMAGTPPSGGSVTPSKLTGLGDDLVKPVLVTLERLWGLRKENFVVKPSMGLLKYDVYQTDVNLVRNVPQEQATVMAITKPGTFPQVRIATPTSVRTEMCRLLVVCTGAFGAELLPEVYPDRTLTAKIGVSFRFAGRISQAFAEVWAPYKKIFVHPISIGNDKWETWGCDGSALIAENWTDERTEECKRRVMKAMGAKVGPHTINKGLRPFHSSGAKPCYLEEVDGRIWAATGAGKFGCISAGWAANQLLARAK